MKGGGWMDRKKKNDFGDKGGKYRNRKNEKGMTEREEEREQESVKV